MRFPRQEYWSGLPLPSPKRWDTVQFSSVQSLSRVRLFETPWIAARQASLSITNSQSSPKLMCIESVMPSSHLILCRPLLLLPPIPPSIRVFSNESTRDPLILYLNRVLPLLVLAMTIAVIITLRDKHRLLTLFLLLFPFQRANGRLIKNALTGAHLSLVSVVLTVVKYPAWSPLLHAPWKANRRPVVNV